MSGSVSSSSRHGRFRCPLLVCLLMVMLGAATWAQEPKRPEGERKAKAPQATRPPARSSGETAGRAVALNGYCPVAYRFRPTPTKGNPAYASRYAGELYYFAGATAKDQFDKDPQRFAPQFGGLCTTALGGSYLKRFPADPDVFMVYHDRVYLFSSERAKDAFKESPDYFIARAESVYNKPALDSYCVVSYQSGGNAKKGAASNRSLYRDYYYHLATPDAKKKFESDPDKYLPQFDGHCAEGMSRGKRFPASPEVFTVHGGKTYLLFDAATKKKFDAEAAAMIKQAEAHWETEKDSPRTPQRAGAARP